MDSVREGIPVVIMLYLYSGPRDKVLLLVMLFVVVCSLNIRLD